MSDFVKKPLYKRLNKKYLFSRLEKLERQMTPTPTQGVADISEIAADAVQVYHNNNKISATTPRGETIDISNYYMFPSSRMLTAQTECFTDDAGGMSPYTLAAFNSGTAVSIASEAGYPGIVRFTNNGSANGGGRIMLFGNTSCVLIGGGEVFETIVRFQSAAAASNYMLGFFDGANNAASVDGVWISFVGNGTSLINPTFTTSNNSTTTSQTPSFSSTIGLNSWYKFRIEINEDATEASLSAWDVDGGAYIGGDTITTNIPTAAGRETSCGVKAWRTNSTSTTLMEVDRVDYYNNKIIRL